MVEDGLEQRSRVCNRVELASGGVRVGAKMGKTRQRKDWRRRCGGEELGLQATASCREGLKGGGCGAWEPSHHSKGNV
jgi:hypothetical protein